MESRAIRKESDANTRKLPKVSLKRIKDEYLGRTFALLCGVLIIVLTISIIGFIVFKGAATFTKHGYSVGEFVLGTTWKPDGSTPKLGALNYILGSTIVSFGAVLLSAPIAVGVAIFMNLISPKFGKSIIQPAMEIFVGIPSVVYGFIGITIIVPMIKNIFGGIGFSILAGIIVLSIMILPTIASLSADAIKSVPQRYLEASYGLGATRWQTIKNVVIPSSKNGIYTGIILGLSRAFGEALAVTMVIGNTVKSPFNILEPGATLTGALTMDISNTFFGTLWNDALWSLGLILLIMSFVFILAIKAIGKRGAKI